MKAGNDAGLEIRYDTYLAHQPGGPTSTGPAGDNRLTSVMEFHDNVPVEEQNPAAAKFVEGWRHAPTSTSSQSTTSRCSRC